jgi:hypothetical protein
MLGCRHRASAAAHSLLHRSPELPADAAAFALPDDW